MLLGNVGCIWGGMSGGRSVNSLGAIGGGAGAGGCGWGFGIVLVGG